MKAAADIEAPDDASCEQLTVKHLSIQSRSPTHCVQQSKEQTQQA